MPEQDDRAVEDPFHLQRFVEKQAHDYDVALSELRDGEKRTHWMWYVFPQIAGLGRTPAAQKYAIRSLAEARAYLAHPVLGPRLVECTEAVLGVTGRSAHEIMGSPDDLKLRSSATLFALAAGGDSVFQRVLDAYYDGEPDSRTLALLGGEGRG